MITQHNVLTVQDAIKFSMALGRILQMDENAKGVWELNCERTEAGLAYGIWFFVNAKERQLREASDLVVMSDDDVENYFLRRKINHELF